MISDNAKTFEATETKEFLRDRGIDWDFILPYAPWNGGFYERMVRSTKRCLKKVLKKNSLTYEEMQTLLMEVENTINNRPLTYIENDFTIEPLSPNHLIYGRCLPMSCVNSK
jgi:transposase InsO family protein